MKCPSFHFRPKRRSVLSWLLRIAGLGVAAVGAASLSGPASSQGATPEFSNGFPESPDFFPIGVWMQETPRAAIYKQMGVNTYVGLWDGPREAQLAELARAGLYAVAKQNKVGLLSANARVIKSWLQEDEPDNAQPLPGGGWGDCIMPEQINASFAEMRAKDPTRPVFLNLGQGVINKAWSGRGSACSRIPHDTYYRAASRGSDILSFDIYPVTDFKQPQVLGRLELVGDGVAQLKRWATPGQRIWTAIGTTHVNSPDRRPTGEEIRAMVWMAIIKGARGITYFIHEWQPSFLSDAIFRYPDMVSSVTLLNAQITHLAPAINSTEVVAVTVDSASVAVMARRHGGAVYLFAVNVAGHPVSARMTASGLSSETGNVLEESRFVRIKGGTFDDNFLPYGVHLYVFPRK